MLFAESKCSKLMSHKLLIIPAQLIIKYCLKVKKISFFNVKKINLLVQDLIPFEDNCYELFEAMFHKTFKPVSLKKGILFKVYFFPLIAYRTCQRLWGMDMPQQTWRSHKGY